MKESEGKDCFLSSKLLTKLVSVFEKFSSDCAIDMSEATESLKSTRLLYGQIFKCLVPDSFCCAVDSLYGYIRQNTESKNERKLKLNLNLLRLLLYKTNLTERFSCDSRTGVNIYNSFFSKSDNFLKISSRSKALFKMVSVDP